MTGDGGEICGDPTGDRAGSTSGVGTKDSGTAGDGDEAGITEGGSATGEWCLLCPGPWEITDPKNRDASIRRRKLL